MPENAGLRMTTTRAALTFVLLSVFIDSLGFGIIIPSLLPVIVELTGEPVAIAESVACDLVARHQEHIAVRFRHGGPSWCMRPLPRADTSMLSV